MKKAALLLLSTLLCHTLSAAVWAPGEWPVLRHYDADHLARIALPLGGIGTGSVSLGGRGELRDWELMNVPAKGNSTITDGNDAPFFALWSKPADGEADTRLLAGPLLPQEYLHYEGRPVNHHGLPRFASASFDAAFPFGQVMLTDETMPVSVRIKAFNPLIPGDAEASGMPLAVLAYEVTNRRDVPVDVAVCGSIRNFIGKDGSRYQIDWKGDRIPVGASHNRNTWREDAETGIRGIFFDSEGVDSTDTAWGNMALCTASGGEVSYRTCSADNDWSVSILNFWDDFSADGIITNPTPNNRFSVGRDQDPMGSLSVKAQLAPGETRTFTFFLTWNFPNRKAWSSQVVGNWYSTRWPDAWQTALEVIPQMPALEHRTLAFVQAMLRSSYPDEVKEAALFNLAVLHSQTVFRLPDGHLMGWEGVMDRFGSCAGSCTHVWNYEMATPFLFGELARSMRDVEFGYATGDDGGMAFRVSLPLEGPQNTGSVAADGQMGCVMKLYRDWQMSGDTEFLRSHWDACKRALSFAWREGSWDADRDGLMEGWQHNTMDVSYTGPNPQMGFWYLGALRAAEEMAIALKDKAIARQCHDLFEKGSKAIDEQLFNGEYYEHRINVEPIPAYQLGPGCLVDQLVGQYMAHICGLGYLADREHIRTTLGSVMKYNYLPDFSRHFNNMRSYVMGNEAGLLMASWPKGRLEIPFPYFSEAMTGFEYCAAVGMLYEGLEDDALLCIRSIRNRFDGAKRNPFSEPECGHHYARSMASWAAIPAISRFHYSAVDGTMSITDKVGIWFWSNGSAWGTVTVTDDSAELEVIEGSVALRSFSVGNHTFRRKMVINSGESYRFTY